MAADVWGRRETPWGLAPSGPRPRWFRSPRSLDGAHAVRARLRLDLGQAELGHERRHVHPEAAAQALLQAVPAADRVVRRACPRLDRALGGRLLLVAGPERHPVAVRFQHLVEILDAAQVVAKLGLADP